jgi:hypothetical protein
MKVRYVIYKEGGTWKGTSEQNYNALIQDAFRIHTFKGMTLEEVLELAKKYYVDIIVKP